MRMSQGHYASMYVTCIAFTDADQKTLLLFTSDQIRAHLEWTKDIREKVTELTGVPGNHIMVTSTHTHSGPDIGIGIGTDNPYYKTYMDAFTGAAQDALADRHPVCAAKVTKTEVDQMNYVRHYILEDGAVIGPNFGVAGDGKIVGHAMPADTQLQLVRLERDGAKDILLTNWQAHPYIASTKTTQYGRDHRNLAGPDYVGACRSYVERETDCLFAFYLGAAGNLTTGSKIDKERTIEEADVYGEVLGGYIVKALEESFPVELGEVKTRQRIFVGENDHSEDCLVEEAKKIRVIWAETNDTQACRVAGEPYGIHGAYHAGAILARASMTEGASMELNACTVGNLAFVTAPYEMFCNNGQFIKENSSYPVTFVLTCANGAFYYLASREAFAHGCYEVDNRRFPEGTAEKAADTLVGMLQELKKNT